MNPTDSREARQTTPAPMNPAPAAEVELQLDENAEAETDSQRIALQAVAREALSNVARHAGASWVEVTVKVPVAHLIQGTPVQATIEARYFFGEPVAGAKVKYVVHTSTHYWWDEDQGEGGEDAGEGSGIDGLYKTRRSTLTMESEK